MDLLDAHQKVQQVESGLKLALLIVGGIAGAISLIALIGAAAAQSSLKKLEAEERLSQPSYLSEQNT